MHPFLARGSRLALYLVAWSPLAALLIITLSHAGPLNWGEALAVLGPALFVYAFICLSTWYLCRSFPLRGSRAGSLAVAAAASALATSGLLVLIVRGLGHAYAASGVFPGVDARIVAVLPLAFGTGVLLNLLAVALHYVFLEVQASGEAQRREVEARVQARDSELRALKAQVNPHFLFNSLHSISALATSDGARARDMCVLLSDFLRSTLGLGEKTSIPLREELALARSYLAIEKVRFGARLRVEERIDDGAQSCLVPPLMLQPLVENSVKHGVSSLLEGAGILIEAERSGPVLRVTVENDFDPDTPARRKGGMGLQNVRKRLHTRHGNEAALLAAAKGGRFRVEIRLPAQMEDA